MPDFNGRISLDLFRMNIYRHETNVTIVAGAISTTTLDIRGGLLRQVILRAGTSSTVFRAAIQESGVVVVLNYGYHTGEIQDTGASGALPLPVMGRYTINITNASRNDSVDVRLLVQE